jgi:predicted deacetylase
MERGVRLAPEEADLIVACLRDKLRRKNRKALAVPPDPAGDHNLTKSPKTVKAAKMVG